MRHPFFSLFIFTFSVFAFSVTIFGEEKIYTDSDVLAFLNQTESKNQSVPVAIEEPAAKTIQDVHPAEARQQKPPSEQKSQPKEKITQQTMTGKIVRVTNESLAVQTAVKKTSSVEYIFPLNSEIQLRSVQSVSELKRGDIIQIKFEQTYRETGDQEKFISKTVVTLIERLQAASADDVYSSMEDAYEQKWGEG